MVRMSLETRQRVITLHSRGHTVSEIRRRIREEDCDISTQSLYNLLRKFREKGTTADLPRQRRPRKITEEMRVLIEQELTNNDELTSTGIRSLLTSRWPDLRVSVATIKRTRKEMGWVCTRPHYCQLLREVRYRSKPMSHSLAILCRANGIARPNFGTDRLRRITSTRLDPRKATSARIKLKRVASTQFNSL